MSVKKLSKAEFGPALQKGLGRAFLYVKNNGDEGVRDMLLNACLHNVAYDPQVEGSRADWLFPMIESTSNIDFYERHILDNAPKSDDFYDVQQMLDLAVKFTERGNPQAKEIIYGLFDSCKFKETWLGGEQIIKIDGLDGFLHIVEVVGSRLRSDPNFWEDTNVLSSAKERLGEEMVLSTLKQKALESENIREYIERLEIFAPKSPSKENIENNSPGPTLPEILERIESRRYQYPGAYAYLCKYSTNEDIKTIFDLLLKEARKEQLIRFLWVFRRRSIPELNDRLFALASDDDKDISDAAVSALANYKDASVHKLAVSFLNTHDWSKAINGIRLLIINHEASDYGKIEQVLRIIPSSIDIQEMHNIVFDIIQLAENNTIPELTNMLLWVYENSPCTNCRSRACKMLVKMNAFPADLMNECLYDCHSGIREMAKQGAK
jgi:hypothetical protein